MATLDIGTIIFVELLGMGQYYPGSPFTGQIINDLVMFLLVPTVFIILVVYTLVGRLTDNTKIKLLLSITLYLFIIFGGYYPMFALLAGPYFIFLIIIIGLLFFFLGHFGLRRGGGGSQAQGMPGRALEAAGYGEALHKLPPRLQGLVVKPALNPRERAELERYRKGLNDEINRLQKRYDQLVERGATRDLGHVALELTRKESERNLIDTALRGGA